MKVFGIVRGCIGVRPGSRPSLRGRHALENFVITARPLGLHAAARSLVR